MKITVETEIQRVAVVDLESLVRIENAAHRIPWSEDEFVRFMGWHLGRGYRDRSGLIAIPTDYKTPPVAFLLCQRLSDGIQIHNLAVEPKCQRQGLGRDLVNRVVKWLREPRVRLVAKVWQANLPAQQFFQALGFFADKVEKNLWGGAGAYRMVFHRFDPEQTPSDDAKPR